MTTDEEYATRAKALLLVELSKWPGQAALAAASAIANDRFAVVSVEAALAAISDVLKRADTRVDSLFEAFKS